MQFRRAVRTAIAAATALLAAAATTVPATTAHADDWYGHHGDTSWRCRHGDRGACASIRHDDWRFHRGGGPLYRPYYRDNDLRRDRDMRYRHYERR